MYYLAMYLVTFACTVDTLRGHTGHEPGKKESQKCTNIDSRRNLHLCASFTSSLQIFKAPRTLPKSHTQTTCNSIKCRRSYNSTTTGTSPISNRTLPIPNMRTHPPENRRTPIVLFSRILKFMCTPSAKRVSPPRLPNIIYMTRLCILETPLPRHHGQRLCPLRYVAQQPV